MNSSIIFLIMVPLVTAFLIPLLDLISIKLRKGLVLTASLVELFLSFSLIINNFNSLKQGTFFLSYRLGGWSPPFGIYLALDGLGLFFSTLVSLSLFLIIGYSIGFIGHHEGKYYVLLFLVLGAMQGAVITGDIFNLYVFIELLTVTSAPLVAFKRNKNSTEAAIKYLFYGIIGGLFFFIGVIFLYYNTGTLNMGEIAASFADIGSGVQFIIISFFLLGILIKLGIFPFHYWLPKAHSACPSSISALLSGVLLKIYLYIFIRIFWNVIDYGILQQIGVAEFIVYLGLISSFMGHIFALQADDIKRMLAFSSIGHIGMIVGVIALGTEVGFYGGLMHIVSHLLMKSALFTGTGYLLQFTPSHLVDDFNGVGYKNNKLFISFITAAMGMIGIPPLIGFISKWFILLAFLEAGNHLGVLLVIFGSLTAVIYYLRYISHGYEQGEPEPERERLILKEFYRERIVTNIVYIYTALLVGTGIFYKFLDIPLKAALKVAIKTDAYIVHLLGG